MTDFSPQAVEAAIKEHRMSTKSTIENLDKCIANALSMLLTDGAGALEEFEDTLTQDAEDEGHEGEPIKVRTVRTIQQSGYLTSDEGLVLTMKDGSEYLLIVKQAKHAR